MMRTTRNCDHCGATYSASRDWSRYCTAKCRVAMFRATRRMEFPAELFERLCAQHKAHTREGIQRLIEVALTTGEPLGTVVRRYLDGDKSVDVSPEYRAAYRDAVDAQHNTGRSPECYAT